MTISDRACVVVLGALFTLSLCFDVANSQHDGNSAADFQPSFNSTVRLEFSGEPALYTSAQINTWLQQILTKKLGLTGENSFVLTGEKSDLNGYTVYRLQQLYKKLPVVGNTASLVLDPVGSPYAITGIIFPYSQALQSEVSIHPEEALNIAGSLNAEKNYRNKRVYWPDNSQQLIPGYELEGIFVNSVIPRLSAERVWVSAVSGEVLERVPLEHGVMNRRVSDFNAACEALSVNRTIDEPFRSRLEAIAIRDYSRDENSPLSDSSSVNESFEMLGQGYEFIEQVLGMDSLDDHGMLLNLFSNVRLHEDEELAQCIGDVFNAYWNPINNSLYVPESGLDLPEVVMHELAHGITTNGSNLVYAFEPGALNESVSDVVGVTFRVWLELGNESTAISDIPGSYWQIRSPDGILRDLADPSSIAVGQFVYPDHYDDWVIWPIDVDQGGVHMNSSIMNLAFYLLSEGGQHPRGQSTVTVNGIGIFKAVRIYAMASSTTLQSTAQFEDARYGFAQTAAILYGEGSEEWTAVHTAMDAVGIPGTWNNQAEPEELPPQEPPAPEPPSPEPPSQPDPASETETDEPMSQEEGEGTDKRMIAFVLLGAGGMILIMAVVVGMRPKHGEGDAVQSRFPSESSPSPSPVPESSPTPAPGPVSVSVRGDKANAPASSVQGPGFGSVSPAPQILQPQQVHPVPSARVIGYFVPIAGGESLPLFEFLLRSSEGQVFGRNKGIVHIQLDSPKVSRRHLRLRLANRALMIEDLNSTGGTWVDGKKVDSFRQVAIQDGQLIRIADFSYSVSLDSTI